MLAQCDHIRPMNVVMEVGRKMYPDQLEHVDVGDCVSPAVVVDSAVRETLRCRADAGQNDGVDAAKMSGCSSRMVVLKTRMVMKLMIQMITLTAQVADAVGSAGLAGY